MDQLGILIGELKAGQEEAERQRGALFTKLDVIQNLTIECRGQISLLSQQFTQQQMAHNALKEYIDDEIEPILADYKEKKNRFIGFALGIGGGSGGIVAFLTKYLSGGGGAH